MLVSALLCAIVTSVSAASVPRGEQAKAEVVPAVYDGKCYYPVPDSRFKLQDYLGRWYQVAGTPFGRTGGARCVTVEYQLNLDSTVKVINTGVLGNQPIGNNGTATPVTKEYGAAGSFRVVFPGFPEPECAGPNYVVQEFAGDHAIVQARNWTVLYIISRERQPSQQKVDAWINRAICLGSNATAILKFDQTKC